MIFRKKVALFYREKTIFGKDVLAICKHCTDKMMGGLQQECKNTKKLAIRMIKISLGNLNQLEYTYMFSIYFVFIHYKYYWNNILTKNK